MNTPSPDPPTSIESILPQPAPNAEPTSRPRVFTIKSEAPRFEPTVQSEVEATLRPSLAADHRAERNPYCKLYFSGLAFERVAEHIGWGRHTLDNEVEQGGILLGHVHRDPQGSIFAIVRTAIAGKSAQGSSSYLAMTHETWAEMLTQVHEILDRDPGSQMQIVGWYHTHPNSLDVFMSGTDRNTQRNFFANDWQFAVVLNPHKRLWRVYHGANSVQCAGFVMDTSEDERESASGPNAGETPPPVTPCGVGDVMMGENPRGWSTMRPMFGGRSGKIIVVLALYAAGVTACAVWLAFRQRSTQFARPQTMNIIARGDSDTANASARQPDESGTEEKSSKPTDVPK